MTAAAYREVFDAAPTALLIADFSRVFAAFDELRQAGIHDVGQHIRHESAFANRCVEAVNITALNAEALTVFGASHADQMVGGLAKILVPDSMPTLAEQIANFADGNTTCEADATVARLDGGRMDVLLRLALSGAPSAESHVIVSITDITWRRRLEQDQRTQGNFVDAIVENMPDALFVKDAENLTIVRCNRAAEALLGQSRQTVYGTDFSAHLPPNRLRLRLGMTAQRSPPLVRLTSQKRPSTANQDDAGCMPDGCRCTTSVGRRRLSCLSPRM